MAKESSSPKIGRGARKGKQSKYRQNLRNRADGRRSGGFPSLPDATETGRRPNRVARSLRLAAARRDKAERLYMSRTP